MKILFRAAATCAAAGLLLFPASPRSGQAPALNVRLSPDPVFVRAGSTMNIAVPMAGDYNFNYLPAGMFRWDEDAADPIGVFRDKGRWTALRAGSSRIFIEPDSLMPARSRLRKSVEVFAAPAKTIPSAPDREVVTIYFPWFSERYIPPPWEPRDSEQWTYFTPTIKPYDPQSAAVSEQHIRMAKDAGIDAFAVSWLTNRVKFDFDYDVLFPPTLNNLARLGPQLGLKIDIHYEAHMNLLVPDGNFTPLATAEERARARINAETDFDYLLHIISPVEDHPAIWVYQAEYVGLSPQDWKIVIDETRRKYPAAVFYGGTYNLAYLAAFDGIYEFAAAYFQGALDSYAGLAAAVKNYGASKKFFATVSPGYDARIFWRNYDLLVPRGNGEYYQMTWDKALAARPDGIFVTSWNEWGETSIIEPTKQFGYQYIDATADNVIRFKSR